MTSIYELFETDEELEQKGVWINYGSAGKFLVARSGGSNTQFAKVLDVNMRPLERQIKNKTLDNELGKKVLVESFVAASLKGWQGVKDKKGKSLPYNKENAIKLFTDLPDLFDDLREQSTSLATYRNEEMEAAAGNL